MYRPDPRAKARQRHCSCPACRKASKAASQRKWLRKAENRSYFRGPEQVARVRQYWQDHARPPRKKRGKPKALQEKIIAQDLDVQGDSTFLNPAALQDEFLMQPSVLLGVISSLTGSALQEQIARNVQRFHTRGQTILGMRPGTLGGKGNDGKASVGAGTVAQGP
ncbi:MAG TPA: hypothetical protein DCZ95_01220 [Verrucomicrobia bacterium]|nr:hypothetical protein [Verrucomicrobiota bacterium]